MVGCWTPGRAASSTRGSRPVPMGKTPIPNASSEPVRVPLDQCDPLTRHITVAGYSPHAPVGHTLVTFVGLLR
jgi:hypothetical protein